MSEYQLIERQIMMMKEVAVASTDNSKAQNIEEHLIHRCYKEYDNKKITICQLRTLLNKI